MNEEEWVDRVGGDGTDDRGDRGGVQPTSPDTSVPDTYRGPYGEPIIIPVTDDPKGHPDYQPGHSDATTTRPADTRLDAFSLPFFRRDGIPDSYLYGVAYHFDRNLRCVIDSFSLVNPGSGQSDHGPSARGNG